MDTIDASVSPNRGPLPVLVLDMQPITPPVGGGRLRLLGLYHALGPDLPTTYIGSYDWPGETYRSRQLTATLTEVTIPLDAEHYRVSERWQRQTGGKTVIDASFHLLGHLSTDFVRRIREEVGRAQVLFFSHPWVYPLVHDLIDPRKQLVIYDSHNVEGWLRCQLLADTALGRLVAAEVVKLEARLCAEADLVFACSHDDRRRFHRLYQTPMAKIRVVPNGVFASRITPADDRRKAALRSKLKLDRPHTAIFIGSRYQPNIDAAKFIAERLAPSRPDILFIVCGSVGEAFTTDPLWRPPANVRFTGVVDERAKSDYLQAADIALNPMAAGSGTNIKMFDYFAAGLPVLTTPIGARGIDPGPEPCCRCVPLEAFAEELDTLVEQPQTGADLARCARTLVEQKYAWERISPAVGRLARRRYATRNRPPFFSVIVPTYERHQQLSRLVELLAAQRLRDFEVIIVDQSRTCWEQENTACDLDLVYLHSSVKGAVKARNSACFLACGQVLAFIDDDCEPREDWLLNAHRYFVQTSAIGVEGLIKCPLDKPDPNVCRIVSNENFRGFGFMTANLFLRTEIFNAVNGFDERFDNPHFREDTDLAWRALDHGPIPFAEDVVVLHPPHPRSLERESTAQRNRFFVQDALLLHKHPRRYQELFFAEKQWQTNNDFGRFLLKGAKRYGIELPAWCRERISAGRGRGVKTGDSLADKSATGSGNDSLQRAGN